VLAIPNGGVPVALQVADALKAKFGLVISRKIPSPLNPESGFGAITDDGTVILNEETTRQMGLLRPQIEYEANKVRAEIKKRSMLYRGERLLVSVVGKTTMVIDDGLASGITMMAAVESVRHRRPREVIVAAPCASAVAVKQLEKVADKVVTCVTGFMPKFYVSDFYRSWFDLSDDDVVRILNEWYTRHIRPS
jgi:putative phosphoribosyl transferase